MKKKNIIYITGRDTYGADLEKEMLMRAFRERHTGHNIDIVRIEEVKDWNTLKQDALSMGLFAEKRLFSFSGGYISKRESVEEEETSKESRKSARAKDAEDAILSLCESIPDDHFFIFRAPSFRSRSALLPWLEAHADKRNFDILYRSEIWEKRFPTLSPEIVSSVLEAYRKMEGENVDFTTDISYAIVHTLEKLTLIGESRKIEKSDIRDSLTLEIGGKMFDLSDAIMRGDTRMSLSIFRAILESSTIYAALPSLIGLLRPAIFVRYMKEYGKKESEIKTSIKAHPFIIQKAYASRIPYGKIRNFYNQILSINIAYRSGQGMKDGELGRILEIELAIMGLKK